MSPELSIAESPDGVTFPVLVSPRASRERVGPVSGGRLKVAVTAPPVEGKANAAVLKAVARALGVARRQVTLVSGERGKRKVVRVEGVDAAAVRRLARPG